MDGTLNGEARIAGTAEAPAGDWKLRRANAAHRIELTVHSRGPVVRGEAVAGDPYAALDLALGKLYERYGISPGRIASVVAIAIDQPEDTTINEFTVGPAGETDTLDAAAGFTSNALLVAVLPEPATVSVVPTFAWYIFAENIFLPWSAWVNA